MAELQGELDLARARVPDLERQLLAARCEMDELEASARSVHRSLQVTPDLALGEASFLAVVIIYRMSLNCR